MKQFAEAFCFYLKPCAFTCSFWSNMLLIVHAKQNVIGISTNVLAMVFKTSAWCRMMFSENDNVIMVGLWKPSARYRLVSVVSFGMQQRQEIAKLQKPGSNACVICGKYNFNGYCKFTKIYIYIYKEKSIYWKWTGHLESRGSIYLSATEQLFRLKALCSMGICKTNSLPMLPSKHCNDHSETCLKMQMILILCHLVSHWRFAT